MNQPPPHFDGTDVVDRTAAASFLRKYFKISVLVSEIQTPFASNFDLWSPNNKNNIIQLVFVGKTT